MWMGLILFGALPPVREITLLYAFSLIPLAVSLDWLFQGKEDFRSVMRSRLFNAIVFALLVFLLVRSDVDARLAAVAFFGGNSAAAILLAGLYHRKYGVTNLRWNPSAWGDILRINIPVGAAMFLSQSVTNLPPIVIGILLTSADVGMYSAAMKLVFVLLIIDRTFNALYLPVATRYAVGRKGEYPLLFSASLNAFLIIMVPLIIGSEIIARPAIVLVFGSAYEQAVTVFQILAGYALITMVNTLFVCTLVAFGKTRSYAAIVGSGAAILSALVICLAFFMGSIGAALGTLLGEGIILAMLARAAARMTRVPRWGAIFKPVVAGAAMAAAAWVMREIPPVGSLAISLVVFGAVLMLTDGLPRAELRYLRDRLV